ncbi:MAG TPA: hypothetical protein VJ927_10855 [Actinomycetota bacterium]|nr:hypothetical protein [Actinomycetota bacterium]
MRRIGLILLVVVYLLALGLQPASAGDVSETVSPEETVTLELGDQTLESDPLCLVTYLDAIGGPYALGEYTTVTLRPCCTVQVYPDVLFSDVSGIGTHVLNATGDFIICTLTLTP